MTFDGSVSSKKTHKGQILIAIAHPDDETFVSGTICLCVEAGFSATLVCFTNGEGGLSEHERAVDARLRRRELIRSAEALGVRDVRFLSAPDTYEPFKLWDTKGLSSQFASLIEALDPILILTHGPRGGYGHPAHVQVFYCVHEAVERRCYKSSLFAFCGQVPGAFFSFQFDDPSDVIVDVRSFESARVASLAEHKSQRYYFLKIPGKISQVPTAILGFLLPFVTAGRKRMPHFSYRSYCRKFAKEGLVAHGNSNCCNDFFRRFFFEDNRVKVT